MVDVLLWVGRAALLAALLGYLRGIARHLWRAVDDARPSCLTASAAASGGGARLCLVQDNAVEGVVVAREGRRMHLRQAVPVGDEVTLGRDPRNSLVIGDRFTSGRHARLFRHEGWYWVEDLGSRNGTLLNGRRVSGTRRLSAGDRITVGSCTFKFMG